MVFKGVLIEESLLDKNVLNLGKTLKTQVEKVTKNHRTPWLNQWTCKTMEFPDENIDETCIKLQTALDGEHEWYIDLKNTRYEITIFKDNIMKKKVYGYNF